MEFYDLFLWICSMFGILCIITEYIRIKSISKQLYQGTRLVLLVKGAKDKIEGLIQDISDTVVVKRIEESIFIVDMDSDPEVKKIISTMNQEEEHCLYIPMEERETIFKDYKHIR